MIILYNLKIIIIKIVEYVKNVWNIYKQMYVQFAEDSILNKLKILKQLTNK